VTADLVPWRVVLLATGAAALLPGQRLQINGLPHEDGPVDIALFTRFGDVRLAEPLPRELVLEGHLRARDADQATRIAGAVGVQLVPLLAFTVNGYVDLPVPWLAFEDAPGLTRRRFWQADPGVGQHLLSPTRLLRDPLLFPLLQATLAPGDRTDRLGRAIAQYHVALRYWTVPGQPLAMAHLYMALEALGPLAERATRERLGLPDDRAHAVHRGVDVSRGNWKDVLLGWVRRDEICRGDKAVYDAAKDATSHFRHGSAGLAAAYRGAGEGANRLLLDYVRCGVLDLLDLPDQVNAELAGRPPLDITPVRFEVSGELHGEVSDPDRLGEAGSLYPYTEWGTSLDGLQRLEDGTLRLSPRLDLRARIAPSVQLTFTHHAAQTGVNDPDRCNFDWPASGDGSSDLSDPETAPTGGHHTAVAGSRNENETCG